MGDWQLVPVEPTEEMLLASLDVGADDPVDAAWGKMLAAAPDPAADPALIEMVARTMWAATNPVDYRLELATADWAINRMTFRKMARAVLRAVAQREG